MPDTIPLLSALRAARDGRGPWAAYSDAADEALEEYFDVSRPADVNIIAAEAVMRDAMPVTEHDKIEKMSDKDCAHWNAAEHRNVESDAPVIAVAFAATGRVGSTQIPLLTPHENELIGGGLPGWWMIRHDPVHGLRGEALPKPASSKTVRKMARAAGWHILNWTNGDIIEGPMQLTLHDELETGGYATEPYEIATCYGLNHAADTLLGILHSIYDWEYLQVRVALEDGSDATGNVLRTYAKKLAKNIGNGIGDAPSMQAICEAARNIWPDDVTEAFIEQLEIISGITDWE